jgi:hypothetical protein
VPPIGEPGDAGPPSAIPSIDLTPSCAESRPAARQLAQPAHLGRQLLGMVVDREVAVAERGSAPQHALALEGKPLAPRG